MKLFYGDSFLFFFFFLLVLFFSPVIGSVRWDAGAIAAADRIRGAGWGATEEFFFPLSFGWSELEREIASLE